MKLQVKKFKTSNTGLNHLFGRKTPQSSDKSQKKIFKRYFKGSHRFRNPEILFEITTRKLFSLSQPSGKFFYPFRLALVHARWLRCWTEQPKP